MAISLDKNQIFQNAEIEGDTILFRLALPLYSSQADLLTGKAALRGEGRYHGIHQETSYVSDSALLCMAEILYHMSRDAMDVLVNNGTTTQWQNQAQVLRYLVIFDVHNISDLMYIDTQDCRRQTALHAQELVPSTLIVHPDCVYPPLHRAGNFYRRQSKNGIVYPSARHSQNLAVALFLDHTASIKSICAALKVTLTLVEEGTGQLAIPPRFDPNSQKISHTQGHYEFDPTDFASNQALLNPSSLAASGIIDFVRRP